MFACQSEQSGSLVFVGKVLELIGHEKSRCLYLLSEHCGGRRISPRLGRSRLQNQNCKILKLNRQIDKRKLKPRIDLFVYFPKVR
jgi:hypothetical protein